ncbi:MAG: dihydroxyacetone kinase subunit L [Acidobacteriaceae bacterium]|nr:dihydroxyacetone kinase subunit L [Acidobacteriaceae bacterium]MBV9499880.1 dihydroxyacetone kinase subunit L [Acidobacteriaceae bacterium]
MSECITKDEFGRMVAGAATEIRTKHVMLSELDCAAGDGDHGATMLRTMEKLEKAFAPGGSDDLKICLKDAGWSVLGVDGGASSSLLGVFFTGMADAVGNDLTEMFEAGLAALQKQTKARPGDKTMMDALVPAINALRSAANGGKSVREALYDAAAAARAGADATRNLQARYGRAKFLGEKTLGHADPGATSISFLFEGFYNGFTSVKGESNNA